MEWYIIQDLVTQGYWNTTFKEFKGIMFATSFSLKSLAQNEIIKIKKTASQPMWLTIIQLY